MSNRTELPNQNKASKNDFAPFEPFNLPPNIAVSHCSYADADAVKMLHQQSIKLPKALAGASSKRKNEYLAGRFCCQKSLDAIGVTPNSLQPHPAGSGPIWPQGCVGSISHSKGQAAAVVSNDLALLNIGMDIEKVRHNYVKSKLMRKIITASEQKNLQIDQNHSLNDQDLFYICFSLKESFYKCLYPVTNVFFWFHAAKIESIFFSIASAGTIYGKASITLTKTLTDKYQSGFTLPGIFAIQENYVYSVVFL